MLRSRLNKLNMSGDGDAVSGSLYGEDRKG